MTDRPVFPALLRGVRLRCPQCGVGRLFEGYLTVRDACSHCGEAFHHHRADDAPPYIVVLILGHIGLPLAVWWMLAAEPPLWLYLAVVMPGAVLGALWLLPRAKGAIVAIQWANRMHGFGGAPADERTDP
jgi:uncharacterized protein (DUF983 family)